MTFSTAWQLANNHAISSNTANAPVVGLTSGNTPVVDGGFYVSAGGFLPGSDVTITLHSTPTVLAVTPADWQGNIGLPLQLPPGLPLGLHTVTATGIGPDGAPLSESSSIDAVAPDLQISATYTKADGSTYVPGTWTDQAVSVSFSCIEPSGPGVASVSSPVVLSGAGSGQTATGTCTDVGGGTLSRAFGPVDIDLTPPEAVITFDPTTDGLAVHGRDAGGSGVPTGAVTPVIQPNRQPGHWNQELARYRITDGAGNTLDLVLSLQVSGRHLAASVISTAYDGRAPIPAPANRLSFTWSQAGPKGGVALLQDVMASGGPTRYHVLALYWPARGQTLVLDLVRGLVETGTGEVLVQTTTQAGRLVAGTSGDH